MDVEHELSAKRIERNVFEAELDSDELWDDEEYQRLQQRIAELEEMVADGEADAGVNEATLPETTDSETAERGSKSEETAPVAFETNSQR